MTNKKPLALAISLLLLAGCSTTKVPDSPMAAKETPQQVLVNSLEKLAAQRATDPDNIELKSREQIEASQLVNIYLLQAEQALKENRYVDAADLWRKVLNYQPGNSRAMQGLRRISTYRALNATYTQAVNLALQNPEQALQKIQLVLEEEPNWPQAKALRDHLLRKLSASNLPYDRMNAELKKTISLNFRSHNIIDIFNTISQMTGVNIIYDNDVSTSAKASIVASNTTAEDAINLLLLSNQLRKKILNGNTLLIYPASQSKDKIYREIEVKTFFLGYAKAKEVNVALRNMLKIKDIHVDERTNTITIRAPSETVSMAERLLVTLDRPEAEVTLEVQVLEISSKDSFNLGIKYPEAIGVQTNPTTTGEEGKSGTTVNNIPLSGLSKNNISLLLGDGIKVNVSQLISKSKVLANPRIRVKNGKKAEIEIGEEIPIKTAVVSSEFKSDKVEYKNVGLKLQVMPDISLDGSITMDVNFELSNLGIKEDGNYRTSKRAAKTVMSSENGQTQILAGLIKQDQQESEGGIPWLNKIPVLGYLFGSKGHEKQRTEVVLLITPHLERNLDLPGGHVSSIPLGTEDMPGEQNTILHSEGKIKLNAENFSLPELAPPAQLPALLADPMISANEVARQ